MGKTLTRDERKNHKFTKRDDARKQKELDFYGNQTQEPKRQKPRPKWRPHSEIDAD